MARVVYNFYYIIGVIFMVALDQIVKAYITMNNDYLKNMNFFIVDFLELSKYNSLYLFLLLNISILSLFWFFLKKKKIDKANLIFSLVLAGVISNLLDRTAKGYVVDYIHLYKIVFNLADVLIFIGILIFFVSSMSNLIILKEKDMRKGMTLIEIMVVIVILGILGTFVGMNVFGAVDDAKESKAVSELSTIKTALARSYGKFNGPNGLPKSLNELVPKYLDEQPEDPWGKPYVYNVPGKDGQKYELYSAGPDGQEGTKDDISSRKKKEAK
jgi:general secretion pathway protein G